VAEAVALAVSICAKRYPESFGKIADWEQHQQEIKNTRQEVDRFYGRMRESFSALDIMIDTSDLTPTQRDPGLLLCTFARWPHISLARPDWPEQGGARSLGNRTHTQTHQGRPSKSPRRAIRRHRPAEAVAG